MSQLLSPSYLPYLFSVFFSKKTRLRFIVKERMRASRWPHHSRVLRFVAFCTFYTFQEEGGDDELGRVERPPRLPEIEQKIVPTFVTLFTA